MISIASVCIYTPFLFLFTNTKRKQNPFTVCENYIILCAEPAKTQMQLIFNA